MLPMRGTSGPTVGCPLALDRPLPKLPCWEEGFTSKQWATWGRSKIEANTTEEIQIIEMKSRAKTSCPSMHFLLSRFFLSPVFSRLARM